MTPTPETSESLLIRVRDPEDRAAWDRFDAIYRPVVYRVARRAGWQHCDAEDLTQRVMVSVAKAVPEWRKDHSKGGFRSWLYAIARNALISTLRKSGREPAGGGSEFLLQSQTIEGPASELERLIDQEHHRSLLRRAAELVRDEFKDTSWQAFWLTTLGELSVPEAAEKLQLSTGAVYAARSRILRRLQEVAGQYDHEEMATQL
ncbi:ECF RNA polymerase sigma factor SigE [Rubripirellula tenax]|uniref:ECF RNA polymerase sigma factor SigE n=1 Tax=Rubripirellula tenax TaxID=2528015 RepID=A0A5C6FHC2_9BACT|nr:sigma-70 family RNA polymerase sigma factor [Rubripirellula tenax]TWU58991.1 ECF RNA polymerase sigma factor SigE [Rubripirellula tenax]